MMSILSYFVEDVMEIFMDDFSIYGSCFERCLENLEIVLQRSKDKIMALNWEKCHFMVTEGIILGHKISTAGLEVDQAKISVIRTLIPSTHKFSGTCRVLQEVYQRFLKNSKTNMQIA